jgi:hypothetical protein
MVEPNYKERGFKMNENVSDDILDDDPSPEFSAALTERTVKDHIEGLASGRIRILSSIMDDEGVARIVRGDSSC